MTTDRERAAAIDRLVQQAKTAPGRPMGGSWGPLGILSRDGLAQLADGLPAGGFASYMRRHHDALYGLAGQFPEAYAELEAAAEEAGWSDLKIRCLAREESGALRTDPEGALRGMAEFVRANDPSVIWVDPDDDEEDEED